VNLLGESFLKRLVSVEQRNGTLVLHREPERQRGRGDPGKKRGALRSLDCFLAIARRKTGVLRRPMARNDDSVKTPAGLVHETRMSRVSSNGIS
jgi:hypothetical protein